MNTAQMTQFRVTRRLERRRVLMAAAGRAIGGMLSRAGAALLGATLTLTAGLSSLAAHADDIVYIEGITTSSEATAGQSALGSMSSQDAEDICSIDELELAQRLTATNDAIADQLANVDPALGEAFAEATMTPGGSASVPPVLDALDRICETPAVQRQVVKLVYSTCRMTMRDGTNMIDVSFPPGSGQGVLTFMDPATFQATEVPLEFTRLMNEDTGVVQGTDGGNGVGAAGNAEDRQLNVNYETVTLTGRQRSFDFRFDLNIMRSIIGLAGFGAEQVVAAGGSVSAGQPSPQELAQMEQLFSMLPTPVIHSYGTALITPDAPGLDIIRTFYRTMATAMGAESSYLGGLYNHELLRFGFPLELQQTTEMNMDVGALFGGLASQVGGQRSTSTMEVTRIVGPLSTNNDFCSGSIVPPEYTITDPTSGLTSDRAGGAAGGAPGGVGPGSAASAGAGVPGGLGGLADAFANDPEAAAAMADGMAELNNALANMSDEDRAAMEQLGGGLGALLGGALSGQGFPGAAPGGAAGGSPDTAPATAGPSSSDLMTGDLTQSVQNMLQALGYDPGNTDGDLGTQTIVAISQFQAERGLEVTGEVTPQLVGILAAAVDSR